MKRLFLILSILMSFTLNAQELKKVKENTSIGLAKYDVLKSDMSTKHGDYKLVGSISKTLLVDGNYSYGKKHGPWVERFDTPGGGLKSMGNFEEGEKVREWTYFDTEGFELQVYDYTNEVLVKSVECNQNESYEYYFNGIALQGSLDCPPSIIGGLAVFKDEFKQNIISYLSEDLKKGTTQLSMDNKVSFFIDENGEISTVRYSPHIDDKNLRDFIEAELAERNGEWLAALRNDEKVKAKLVLPINFSIKF